MLVGAAAPYNGSGPVVKGRGTGDAGVRTAATLAPVFGYYRNSRKLEKFMPWITVQLLAGRTVEQKKELVAALTRETSRVCGCSTDAVQIVIEDVQKDNWGIGGMLASEKFPGPASALGSGDPRYQKHT